MKLSIFRNIFLAMLLMATPTQAGNIDMTTDTTEINSDPEVIGVNISDSYYTVTMEDDVVKKIELNGEEQPDLIIDTDWEELWYFISHYEDMSWLDKARYLIKKFEIPTKMVLGI